MESEQIGKGMDTRNRRRREEVRDLLDDYRSSGLTQKDWCGRRGIKMTTLGFWLSREKNESEESSLVALQIDRPESRLPLSLKVGKVCLSVEAGSDLKMLAKLLKELSQ